MSQENKDASLLKDLVKWLSPSPCLEGDNSFIASTLFYVPD